MEDQIAEDKANCPLLHKITTDLENECDEQDELIKALENPAFYRLPKKG